MEVSRASWQSRDSRRFICLRGDELTVMSGRKGRARPSSSISWNRAAEKGTAPPLTQKNVRSVTLCRAHLRKRHVASNQLRAFQRVHYLVLQEQITKHNRPAETNTKDGWRAQDVSDSITTQHLMKIWARMNGGTAENVRGGGKASYSRRGNGAQGLCHRAIGTAIGFFWWQISCVSWSLTNLSITRNPKQDCDNFLKALRQEHQWHISPHWFFRERGSTKPLKNFWGIPEVAHGRFQLSGKSEFLA